MRRFRAPGLLTNASRISSLEISFPDLYEQFCDKRITSILCAVELRANRHVCSLAVLFDVTEAK